MIHVTQVVTIQASIDVIWKLIGDFRSGSSYLSMVTHCTMHGEGIGALRTLTYLDGSVILERLETVDDATHCLAYTLLSDTPFGDCLTTMTLRALSGEQSELHWTANFQPTSLPVNEAVSLMEGMLVNNCLLLKELLEH